jgi:hypothetical protein
LALSAAPAFAATTSVMVAGPVPELAPETVIQVGSPETLQAHVMAVVSVMGNVPPVAVAVTDVGFVV